MIEYNRKIETEAECGDTKKCVSEEFRGILKNAGISLLYLREIDWKGHDDDQSLQPPTFFEL